MRLNSCVCVVSELQLICRLNECYVTSISVNQPDVICFVIKIIIDVACLFHVVMVFSSYFVIGVSSMQQLV